VVAAVGDFNELMPIVLPLLLTVLSHGHSAPPAGSPPALKPAAACAGITASDIEQALGEPVRKGQERNEALGSSCDYGHGDGHVTITVQHSRAALDLPREIESLRAAFPEATLRPASGIGTRAFFCDFPGGGTQLHILRGEHDYVLVSILGFGQPAEVAGAARRLAEKALARLER
jgi:hypothetical protein